MVSLVKLGGWDTVLVWLEVVIVDLDSLLRGRPILADRLVVQGTRDLMQALHFSTLMWLCVSWRSHRTL